MPSILRIESQGFLNQGFTLNQAKQLSALGVHPGQPGLVTCQVVEASAAQAFMPEAATRILQAFSDSVRCRACADGSEAFVAMFHPPCCQRSRACMGEAPKNYSRFQHSCGDGAKDCGSRAVCPGFYLGPGSAVSARFCLLELACRELCGDFSDADSNIFRFMRGPLC